MLSGYMADQYEFLQLKCWVLRVRLFLQVSEKKEDEFSLFSVTAINKHEFDQGGLKSKVRHMGNYWARSLSKRS